MSRGRELGRQQRKAGPQGPAAIAKAVAVIAAVAVTWHIAVWAAADGMRIGDVQATGRALFLRQPLGGLGAGIRPGSPGLTLTLWAVFLLGPTLLGWAVVRAFRRRVHGAGGEGLATGAEARSALGEQRARDSAAQTRAATFTRPDGSFDPRAAARADLREVGWSLGRQLGTGQRLVATPEDSVAVIAPSGAGKSRTVVIPACLDAPGPLVVTSTRADVLDVIAEPRSRLGRVWVFDPLDTVGWPDPMVWDPIAGCADGETATSRALSFSVGMGADDSSSSNAGFFRQTASSALTRLLHAADLERKTIEHVLRWATNLENANEPRAILADHPRAEPGWDVLLRSVSTGADETIASTRQTLAAQIEPLALRKVLRCVTPQPGVALFQPDAFVASRDTLVLISDANASTNVAPLTTMLLGEVVDAAKRRAPRTPSGRLDPFIRLVLDEVANVAPLPKLPALASDARGYGIHLVYALQSLGQAVQRWGRQEADTLLDNAAATLVMGGLKDVEALRRFSELVGETELTEVSTQRDTSRLFGYGTVKNEREKRVLRPEEIRQLPNGQALLLFRGAPGVIAQLEPWDQRREGRQLRQGEQLTRQRRLGTDLENV
ncbi:type IV secretory system conjugative DNA transfer family protein [Streptantibioticus ferralitis]|uniref:Type IV secretory system conjugative DNA transfer family protein n=1 Tax=Streptantibioticus ferralitis TaxID=236510 RepID=A0ABT5Z3W5_9ACTN|nr:type IV secretory system conjugative DNA transfer family protein [Streptantibioticus ferralitis]MDF2258516.1 type IV secretory system conjugative DNA transfer family protein [Streptantibioticus ferralitis]